MIKPLYTSRFEYHSSGRLLLNCASSVAHSTSVGPAGADGILCMCRDLGAGVSGGRIDASVTLGRGFWCDAKGVVSVGGSVGLGTIEGRINGR